ncbi:MAG: lytic transglycosylase domain-containing protein [Bacteroidales bacterium]|jgi:membrane-bound lytic murein transglycosylase D|nr:lytic transglycosylase domain-containing protein [Bacteroidales bacterium]
MSLQKNHSLIIISILIVCFLSLFLVNFSQNNSMESKPQSKPYTIKIEQLYIPDSITLFNETVPIHNFDTRESLERELLVNVYWQSQTTMFFKKIGRYFPIIEYVLEKNNVPEDFKYLALAESGFLHNVSPSGATGYWQFLEKTAEQYGLTVNHYIDERYDIEKSTEAACKYFKKAYERFGSWTLAAASYNVGMYGLNKQTDYQYIDSYYDLHTNSQTGRYVFRVLALKLIMEHPEKYGYFIQTDEKYHLPEFKTLTIDTAISDIAQFAKDHNSNYKLIRIMNPWIRSKSLPQTHKDNPYKIKIVDISQRNTDQ